MFPKAKIQSSVMLWTLAGTLEKRLETAARAGLQSVQLVGEYAGWSEAEGEEFRRRCVSFRLAVDALIATPDWGKRPVSMLDPAQRANFLADVKRAIEWAKRLNCPHIIGMAGNAIPGRTREAQYASLLEGAKRAGDLAAAANLVLIVEPLNSRVDHRGFFLATCTEGLKLVREADNPHVRLLFDIYHEQVQAGDIIRSIEAAAPYTAVFHVADNPGRNDPGTGEIAWPWVYKAIQKSGFAGTLAMEYRPLGDPVESLTRAIDEFRSATAAT